MKKCFPSISANIPDSLKRVPFYIPAKLWTIADVDDPPFFITREYPSTGPEPTLDLLAFPQNENRSTANATYPMPFNWDKGNIKARIYWTTRHSSHGLPVKWRLYGYAVSNGQTIQTDWTNVEVSQTDTADDLLYITTEKTIPISTDTTKKPFDLIVFTLDRREDDESGTADLIGVNFEYGITL